MNTIKNDRTILGADERIVGKIERLAGDLRRYQDGEMPTDKELSAAPILYAGRSAAVLQPILIGRVFGHPVIKDGPITTSTLFAVAPDYSWARTLSRLYRLHDFRP